MLLAGARRDGCVLSRRPGRCGARRPLDGAAPRAGVVAQQALLPQHTDPKLWLVHTKPGAEREAVQCLLQKGVDLALRGTPLQIKSAFTQDHLKARNFNQHRKQILCQITWIKLLSMSNRAWRFVRAGARLAASHACAGPCWTACSTTLTETLCCSICTAVCKEIIAGLNAEWLVMLRRAPCCLRRSPQLPPS